MYGKIFPDIFDSTLMADGGGIAVYVFMSMAVLKDQDGAVRIAGPVLANRLDISENQFDAAIKVLTAPDPNSNLKAMDGRRIVPLSEVEFPAGNRGYFVVNHEHYREKEGRDDQREQAKVRQQRKRERDSHADVTPMSRSVTLRHAKPVYTDTDTDKERKRSARSRASRLPEDWKLPDEWKEWAKKEGHPNPVWAAVKFHDHWISVGGERGTKRNWQATWRNWVRNDLERASANGAKNSAKEVPVWQLSESALLTLAQKKGISTGGKSKQDLINELR